MKKKLIPRALNGTQVLPRTISLELLIGETTTPVITLQLKAKQVKTDSVVVPFVAITNPVLSTLYSYLDNNVYKPAETTSSKKPIVKPSLVPSGTAVSDNTSVQKPFINPGIEDSKKLHDKIVNSLIHGPLVNPYTKEEIAPAIGPGDLITVERRKQAEEIATIMENLPPVSFRQDRLTDLGGKPSTDTRTPELRNKDYWHWFRGAGERLKTIWNNGMHPVQGLYKTVVPAVIGATMVANPAAILRYAKARPILTGVSLVSGMAAGSGVDHAVKGLTNYDSWSDMMNKTFHVLNTDIPAKLSSDMTNPGYFVGGIAGNKYGEGFVKRGTEMAMRSTPEANPIRTIERNLSRSTAKDRANWAKYLFTGKKGNPENTVPSNAISLNKEDVYLGLVEHKNGIVNDYIDAYLYGKIIDPKIAKYKGKNKPEGFEKYIQENYKTKAGDIPTYEVDDILKKSTRVSKEDVAKINPADITVVGSDGAVEFSNYSGLPFQDLESGISINVGGHLLDKAFIKGKDGIMREVVRSRDIWKFDPKTYGKKWRIYKENRNLKDKIFDSVTKMGLNTVNEYGTPIITVTPWRYTGRIKKPGMTEFIMPK